MAVRIDWLAKDGRKLGFSEAATGSARTWLTLVTRLTRSYGDEIQMTWWKRHDLQDDLVDTQ